MKLNRIIISLLSFFLLAACSKDDKDSKKPDGKVSITDTTDRSVCNEPVPVDLDIYRNWIQDSSVSGNVQNRQTYSFNGMELRVTNVCSLADGTVLMPAVSVPVQITQSNFIIQKSALVTQTASGVDCRVDVRQGEFAYRLQGQCLEVTNAQEQIRYLMPLENPKY